MSSPRKNNDDRVPQSTDATSIHQNTNLIINYLPPTLTEEDFFQLFSLIGPIDSFRMMKNDDGTPRGYGFVRFQYPEHAERAIEMYNGYELWGKRLKAAFTRAGGPRENCNIFTTNLPASWTTSTLFEKFGEFGEILEARILTDSQGRSRLCGFVRFDRTESALLAIEEFNMVVPPGAYRPIKVRLAKRQAEHWKSKGVGPYSKEKALLLRNGGIMQHNLMREQNANHHVNPLLQNSTYPSSNPFDRIQKPSSAPPAKYHPLPIESSSGDIQKEAPRKKQDDEYNSDSSALDTSATPVSAIDTESVRSDGKGFRLFICNVPTFFNKQQIMNFCSKYGEILDCNVQKSNEDSSLGMCFVTYSTKEEVVAAQNALDKCEIYNQAISARVVD